MKMIVMILALGLVSYLAYFSITHQRTKTAVVDANGNVTVTTVDTTPQEQLGNARAAAKRIEAEQNERMRKAAGMAGGLASDGNE